MSKFGKLGSFLKQLAKFAPLILATNPVTAKYAPQIIKAIQAAEKIEGSSGAEKKAHVMGVIAPLAEAAHIKGLKGFEDAVLVTETISDGVDTVIGAVKVIEGSRVAVKKPAA